MAKNLKLTIKNAQIAEAINLGSLKNKIAKKKKEAEPQEEQISSKTSSAKIQKTESEEQSKAAAKEEAPRIRARSKSAFAESSAIEQRGKTPEAIAREEKEADSTLGMEPDFSIEQEYEEEDKGKPKLTKKKTSEELRKEIFREELEELVESKEERGFAEKFKTETHVLEESSSAATPIIEKEVHPFKKEEKEEEKKPEKSTAFKEEPLQPAKETPYVKLGPTGRHIKDLLPNKYPAKGKKEEVAPAKPAEKVMEKQPSQKSAEDAEKLKEKGKAKPKIKGRTDEQGVELEEENASPKKGAALKVKEFRDIKPAKRQETTRFDVRDRHGLRDTEEDQGQRWRKRRQKQARLIQEDVTIRPSALKIRIPISIKDLASEMKLKASQLISKLFMQGVVVTLNDFLEDETTIQLLGHEFGCEISIDTSEEERIRITQQSAKDEISSSDPSQLEIRAPVVAFMGHVDHGKTSLIDTIRKSNRAAGEAGAITQHIGAFRCSTPVGDIAILDTPGHEAFSAMRARGADVTDIVVLVIAGDEGIRQQTLEAIQHAKAANVTIVVALNKCDKPNFNAENVYRQLAENELLPEAWGGQTITVNCSAFTGEGIPALLEMLALQAEVLELRANPHTRARGRVLESEMHKGMGAVATVLVQNGTLKLGDSLVFDQFWGRVKTMQNEYGQQLENAGPSTPVEITGLSGLPEAGQEFIVVKSEKEAREIAEMRMQGFRQSSLLLKKKVSLENLFQQASEGTKKILNVVLRADVQGSLEALKVALMKIESNKAELNIIFTGVGEVSESDIQLAAASKAVVIGFHTQIESHAEALVKQLGVQVRMHDIIYHAIDDAKILLAGLLDRIAQETDKGKALVKATFKSSQHGIIAGCQVIEGAIHRNNHVRVVRDEKVIAQSPILSLKRVKEDVREVQKGLECGIVLSSFSDFHEGDILEAFEITYITQEL